MAIISVLGSSTAWTPRLVTDLMCVFKEPLEIRLIDIAEKNPRLCQQWGQAATRHLGRKDRFRVCLDRRDALKGSDAVLVTVSTGGFPAMAPDVAIPEKYGIYATVGDTTGPGGWSRTLRNLPVFQRFAEDFARYCPSAIIANYTNPMAALTAVLQQNCPNPVVGLCHSYFETKDVICRMLGEKDWSRLSIAIAGMNHCTWVTDFRVGREDGYSLLRRKIGRGSIGDLLPRSSEDDIGFASGHKLFVELYNTYGYMPYPADRHIAEFFSFALAGCPGAHPKRTPVTIDKWDIEPTPADVIDYCTIERTPMAFRMNRAKKLDEFLVAMAKGKHPHHKKSRETGAEMIRAYLENAPFVDAVNTMNVGQIPGLPPGACVETLGMVDGLGVRPLVVPNIPDFLLAAMRPQALAQDWTVRGAMTGDRDLLLQALLIDPQCAHLKPTEVRRMANELLRANAAVRPPR